MWVLEADGDIFNGKRLWLRPGKRFLLGRTASVPGQVAISHKSVSKRHLIIEVGQVTADDCPNLRARSLVTVEDLNTKQGTTVNGDKIKGTTSVLQKDFNTIALAQCESKLRITWVPVTLTFSFGAKEAKANPYPALYETLGPLDIKVLINFQRGITSHVVARKRNTPRGLQALIDGKFIVNSETFVDAIVAATTPATPEAAGGETKSPLEEDWDANFPNATEHLPPRGEEPTERDDSAYAPNLERQSVFEGYTFVFYDKKQFESLLAPINDGGGKAFFREVIPFEIHTDDFIGYIKGVAGEKGLGEFEDGSEGKGVVVVRFNPNKGSSMSWYDNFNHEVSLSLDHRLIEQNEFLDAILGNDSSVLRRSLQLGPPGTMEPTPSPETTRSDTLRGSQASADPAPTPATPAEPAESSQPEPVRRGRSRRTVARRFKGFDDDDDDDPVSLASIPEASAPEPAPVEESQGLFVSQDPEMEDEYQAPQTIVTQTRSSRKRSAPPVEYEPEKKPKLVEDEEDLVDKLAPTAAALRKRRLAEQTARRGRGEPSPPPESVRESPEPEADTPKKVKKEFDILELARTKREEAEELARKEREALQEALDGMDIEAIRNLAIIEEIEIKRRPPPQRAGREDESDRWDDRWNGRKNFKKFRRRGEAGGRGRDFHRVIVPLEEVKKKDFGIGDDYWLETDTQRRSKKDRGQGSQDTLPSQSRQKTAAPSRALEPAELDESDNDVDRIVSSDVEVIDEPPPPARTSRSQKSQRTTATAAPTQTKTAPANSKRPAPASFAKPAPKKTRQAPARRKDDSDDSEDELKFRFRR